MVLFGAAVFLITGCGTTSPHDGRIPFCWTEVAPTPPSGTETLGFEKVGSFDSTKVSDTVAFEHRTSELKPGDVIAFYMGPQEAWSQLAKGKIQKLPYELLRYGHLAVVIPGATNLSTHVEDLRLLQVPLMQPVEASDSVEYLRDKSWEIHRPPASSIDSARLREFADVATKRGASWVSYDLSGMLGINNATTNPQTVEDIDDEYSCATLVVAALHYSGFELHATHRDGWLDMVSPRQVIESRAKVAVVQADRRL